VIFLSLRGRGFGGDFLVGGVLVLYFTARLQRLLHLEA